MVHKLAIPSQHQTVDLVQNHVISWHHQCKSCCWPALINRWCNQCHQCASGKKQGRSWVRKCHHFSAPHSQCATNTWSWPSCHEVGYNRHLLNLPRGMRFYSYQDGDDAKDGDICSIWWFSIDKSEVQDVAAPKDSDQHGDPTDQFKLFPPCWLQWSGNWHVCVSNTTLHPEDLHIVCCLIEHSLLPHIDCVIDHHKHMFVMHNIAHLCCKGHLDDIYWHSFFSITLSLQLWKKTTQIWYWDSLIVVLQL